jgi:hypothetical protein
MAGIVDACFELLKPSAVEMLDLANERSEVGLDFKDLGGICFVSLS